MSFSVQDPRSLALFWISACSQISQCHLQPRRKVSLDSLSRSIIQYHSGTAELCPVLPAKHLSGVTRHVPFGNNMPHTQTHSNMYLRFHTQFVQTLISTLTYICVYLNYLNNSTVLPKCTSAWTTHVHKHNGSQYVHTFSQRNPYYMHVHWRTKSFVFLLLQCF